MIFSFLTVTYLAFPSTKAGLFSLPDHLRSDELGLCSLGNLFRLLLSLSLALTQFCPLPLHLLFCFSFPLLLILLQLEQSSTILTLLALASILGGLRLDGLLLLCGPLSGESGLAVSILLLRQLLQGFKVAAEGHPGVKDVVMMLPAAGGDGEVRADKGGSRFNR